MFKFSFQLLMISAVDSFSLLSIGSNEDILLVLPVFHFKFQIHQADLFWKRLTILLKRSN